MRRIGPYAGWTPGTASPAGKGGAQAVRFSAPSPPTQPLCLRPQLRRQGVHLLHQGFGTDGGDSWAEVQGAKRHSSGGSPTAHSFAHSDDHLPHQQARQRCLTPHGRQQKDSSKACQTLLDPELAPRLDPRAQSSRVRSPKHRLQPRSAIARGRARSRASAGESCEWWTSEGSGGLALGAAPDQSGPLDEGPGPAGLRGTRAPAHGMPPKLARAVLG